MEHYNLTPETLRNAKTYLPIAEKMAFVSDNAPKCFDRLQITHGDEQMPHMYMENTGIKSRYLMYALASKYLGLDVETAPEDDALLTESEYDRFAGIMAQIDRFKKDKTTQNAAYELASDYYDLEKRMNQQIRGLLEVQNDPVVRQQMIQNELVKQIPGILESIKELQEKKGVGANGA